MNHTYASKNIQAAYPVYLDCNATAPIEPSVRDVVIHWLTNEPGNAGSRTHEFGHRAKKAVQTAREQIAAVVAASADEIVFTSGATESNNVAILGLASYGETLGRRHIIASAIEHKAVLEPLEALKERGFSITLIRPQQDGAISPDAVKEALRPETLLVSLMQINNETGARQPVEMVAEALGDHDAYFHVDAAQGFGKELSSLRNQRIDLISVSGHKIYAPAGIGALIMRKRGFKRPPLKSLIYGGGQERGLRPGTLPVPLIAGLGKASEIAVRDNRNRMERCQAIRVQALEAFNSLDIRLHAAPEITIPHVLNLSVPGVDSEAIMVALKDLVAISNGSACTSHSYTPSHVLEAMGLPSDAIAGAIRISWSHLTPDFDWTLVARRIEELT